MSIIRRLDRLETHYPAGPGGHDRAVYRAWLATLPDADIEILAEAAERIEAGGDPAALGAATCEALARIAVTWETYQAGAPA